MVSKADAFGGGASKCAQDLTALLNSKGIASVHLCSWAGNGWTDKRLPLYGRFGRMGRGMHFASKKIGLPEVFPVELPIFFRRSRLQEFDLFHFHDLSSAISPLTLLALSKFRPVVWTIHDCSPFTGGCLYPMDCEKFRTKCSKCPQEGIWPIDNSIVFTSLLQSIKGMLHKSRNLFCTTPSNWMADMALSSKVINTRPHVIGNGVDVTEFKHLDKKSVRAELGLPESRPTILLSAGHLSDPRKGVRHSLAAIKAIRDLNPMVLLMGAPSPEIDQELGDCGIECHQFGYVSDTAHLNKCYAAADCFLFCSLADNQPLAVLESMASGTPVLGFETGGIPELVDNDRTGFLVPQLDQDALGKALRYGFENKKLHEWGKQARKIVEQTHSHESYVMNHIRFYENIIQGK